MTTALDAATRIRFLALLAQGGGPLPQSKIVPIMGAPHKAALLKAGLIAKEKKGVRITPAGEAQALEIMAGPLLGGRPTSTEKVLAFFLNRLAAQPAQPAAPADVKTRLWEAYQRAKRGSGLARLAAMRPFLAGLDRQAVDNTIRALHEANAGLTLMREDNQRALTAADHEAAIDYKGEARHIILWAA